MPGAAPLAPRPDSGGPAGAEEAGGAAIRKRLPASLPRRYPVHPRRRPASSDHARTSATVLDRIRALAPEMADERIAEVLDCEGLTTRMGLPWTTARVYHIRTNHRIRTGCPTMPQDDTARGDGLVSVRAAAAILGISPSTLEHWHKEGLIRLEQRGAGSPLWIRLTPEEIARLDGTLAAEGHGQWRIREARRILGVTKERLREKARHGEIVAYRGRVDDHWEWPVSPMGQPVQSSANETRAEDQAVRAND